MAVFGITTAAASVILLLSNYMFKYTYQNSITFLNTTSSNYRTIRWHFNDVCRNNDIRMLHRYYNNSFVYDMLPYYRYINQDCLLHVYKVWDFGLGALVYDVIIVTLYYKKQKNYFLLLAISLTANLLLSILFTKPWKFGAAAAM